MNKLCEYCGCHTGGHTAWCVRPIHTTATDYSTSWSVTAIQLIAEIQELRKRLASTEARLDLAEKVCEAATTAMNSEVVKSAPFAGYSESLLILKQSLDEWRNGAGE